MTDPLAKVAICMPYYRQVEGPTFLAGMDLMCKSTEAKIATMVIGTSGAYVEDNRNGCVEYAIATGIPFDWLLWIDSDMIFPGNALLRLLSHDKDIVGANYRQRTPPYKSAGIYLGGDDTKLLEPGLHEMEQMPTGLLLTRFSLYREMGYPWFKPGTRDEARDDIYFCRQAKARGHQIWCDHDLTKEVRHVTVQEIPWFSPEQLVRVEAGTGIDNAKAAAEGEARARLSKEQFTGRSAA